MESALALPYEPTGLPYGSTDGFAYGSLAGYEGQLFVYWLVDSSGSGWYGVVCSGVLSELSPSAGLDPSRLNGFGCWLSVMRSSVTHDRAHSSHYWMRPSVRTASRSSISSATLLSILPREKSLISRPGTIWYAPSEVVQGNEEISPSGIW